MRPDAEAGPAPSAAEPAPGPSGCRCPPRLLLAALALAALLAPAAAAAPRDAAALAAEDLEAAPLPPNAAAAPPPPPTTDDLYLCRDKFESDPGARDLPQLRIEQILDSTKPRAASDVTLVTQLSFERLYMLEGQCDVWNGAISAAVYIPLVSGRAVTVELNSNQDPRLVPIDAVRAQLREFHAAAEAASLCKLDLQLVAQEVESVWLSALYPVNAMRNRAIANARTDVILLLDVDFWPSRELSELLHRPGKYASLLAACSSGTAVVLPAFETADSGEVGVEVAREAVAGGKDAAAVMFWDGRARPFHTDRYKAGHRATDFRRW
jgi:hypothetical protein